MMDSLLPQGYFIEYGPHLTEDAEARHTFCGEHAVAGAQCPNCRKPLLRFVELDMGDPALQPVGCSGTRLTLLFCWTCNISQESLFYRHLTPDLVELFQYGEGGACADFPYEVYPATFPEAPARLVPLTSEEQSFLHRLNRKLIDEIDAEDERPDLCQPRHQVGGEPYLVQGARDGWGNCPACGAPMSFLAAIGDDCLDPRGFTDNAYVQVLYFLCAPCGMIGAVQETE